MKKKRILFHSNYCGVATGFGGFIKELLLYLYSTGKYELYLYAAGINWEHPDFARWPWKIYGTLPNNPQEIESLNKDPGIARMASYGNLLIDRAITTVKPDIYLGIEDFWGISYCIDKPWWNKINSVIVWTADSLPLLKEAVDKAGKIKNHYVWSNFAKNEFHRLGFNNVGLLRGCVDTKFYYKLSNDERTKLRESKGISKNNFCFGFLSRNQLRKLIPNLLEGYQLFKKQNPTIKNTKILLFTHFGEGWDIPRLVKELELPEEEILACYKCRKTGDFFVLPFKGQEIDNPTTNDKKTLVTVSLQDSLSTEQVNLWYNLLDAFVLPITSGGQERALQEAKLCELVTLVNPYSCGEDNCVPEAYSLPLDYATYREIGTQFIKASPYPFSIAKQMKKVYEMDEEKRSTWGRNARKWTLENFSIEVIGKKYEDILDSMPEVNYDFCLDYNPKNENYPYKGDEIKEDLEFICDLYKNVLYLTDEDSPSKPGVQNWIRVLANGGTRRQTYDFFIKTAVEENRKNIKTDLSELFDKTDKLKGLIVCKESAGDVWMVTSLFESFKNQYPAYDLYFACDPKFFSILEGNPYVHKCIPYIPQMENELLMIGTGAYKGVVDVYIHTSISSQRQLNYLSHWHLPYRTT